MSPMLSTRDDQRFRGRPVRPARDVCDRRAQLLTAPFVAFAGPVVALAWLKPIESHREGGAG